MYACMHLCMYVYMCVYIYIYMYPTNLRWKGTRTESTSTPSPSSCGSWAPASRNYNSNDNNDNTNNATNRNINIDDTTNIWYDILYHDITQCNTLYSIILIQTETVSLSRFLVRSPLRSWLCACEGTKAALFSSCHRSEVLSLRRSQSLW